MTSATTSAATPVRITGATPVHSFASNPRSTHAPMPTPIAQHESAEGGENELFWIELESTLQARDAAKALHPSSLNARLRLAS